LSAHELQPPFRRPTRRGAAQPEPPMTDLLYASLSVAFFVIAAAFAFFCQKVR
jgi:hypothetical protein